MPIRLLQRLIFILKNKNISKKFNLLVDFCTTFYENAHFHFHHCCFFTDSD